MRPIFYNTIITLFFLFTSSSCDFDCFEKRQNTDYYLDLYVVESTPPYFTNFEEVRKIELSKKREYPELANGLGNIGNRISDDYTTLVSERRVDFSFINFSNKEEQPAYFQQSDIFTIEEPSLVLHEFFDLNLNEDKILRLGRHVISSNSNFITEFSSINSLDPVSLREDTLIKINSEIIGDSIFIEKNAERIAYDEIDDKVYTIVTDQFMEYKPDQEQPHYPTPEDQVILRLLRLNSETRFDTLFTTRLTSNPVLTLQLNNDQIVANMDGNLYYFNKNGTAEKEIPNIYYPRLSPTGNSLTFNWGKQYYSVTEDYTIDLTEFVPNITYSQAYDDMVLIVENSKMVHFFDVESREITRSLSEFLMPEVEEGRDKFGTKNLWFPVLTPSGNLRLLFTDQYYYDDQLDDCVI